MENEDKIKLLQFNINRFDGYYTSINFKSSFFIISSVGMIGMLFQNKILNNISYIAISMLLITLVFVILAIKPYLKSLKKSNSNIFFHDISSKGLEQFRKDLIQLEAKHYINDLIEQNYYLSVGLKNKFEYLNKATIFFLIGVILFFISLFYKGF